jgi:hypothetical protein
MVTQESCTQKRRVGPYCRAISRGAIGEINGRSPEGKFLRRCEAELVEHVGGQPTFAQALIIRPATRAMLQLEKLDSKLAIGNWTDHDARTYGGLSNTLRLCLRELGLRPPASKPKSPLADHFSRPPKRSAAP